MFYLNLFYYYVLNFIFYRKKLLKQKKKEDLQKAKEIAKESKATKQKPPLVDFSSIVSMECSDFRIIEISKLWLNLFSYIVFQSC